MEQERGPSQTEEILELLSKILQMPETRRALLELIGGHAQSLIDFFDALLLDPHLSESAEPWLRKYTLITLRKLCRNSMLYPQSYILNDIKNVSYSNSEGGSCDIFRGTYNGQAVCLKAVRLSRKSDEAKVLKACAGEGILWSYFDHPNIVYFYGISYLQEAQGRISLVSPWMENGNIVAYLKENPGVPRKPFIYDIASGLEYLHKENIVHGDLKGVNILVSKSQRACIADFGLSTILTNKTLGFANTTSAVSGLTLRWASPELLEDDVRHSRESDIWAFGCVCYEVLTRLLPFQGSSDLQIPLKLFRGHLPAQPGSATLDPVDEVDEGMWKLMNWCWSKVGERPTCQDILRAIEPDASIRDILRAIEPDASTRQFRNACLDNPTQESQKYRYSIRSSSVPVDINQLRQILEDLCSSQGAGPEALSSLSPTLPSLPLPALTHSPSGAVGAPGGGIHIEPLGLKKDGSGRLTTFNPNVQELGVKVQTVMHDKPVFPKVIHTRAESPKSKKQGSDRLNIFKKRLPVDITLIQTLEHEDYVLCVRLSADGKYLATGCELTIQIYDTKTGQKTCVLIHEPATKSSLHLCFSPDGKFLATGGGSRQICIWDIATKSICNRFDGHQDWIISLDFSSDGRLLVSASEDETVRIWDTVDGTSKVLLHHYGIRSAAISPDGEYVATGSSAGMVGIWKVQSERFVEILCGHARSVYGVAFTPDGKRLASGGLDETVKFWDISALVGGPGTAVKGAPGKGRKGGNAGNLCMRTFAEHNSCVFHVGVSHDGRWILWGSSDGTVWFWDVKNGTAQCILQPETDEDIISAMDSSPAGSILATRCVGKRIKIWSYKTM